MPCLVTFFVQSVPHSYIPSRQEILDVYNTVCANSSAKYRDVINARSAADKRNALVAWNAACDVAMVMARALHTYGQ
jgi:hypothetical protein